MNLVFFPGSHPFARSYNLSFNIEFKLSWADTKLYIYTHISKGLISSFSKNWNMQQQWISKVLFSPLFSLLGKVSTPRSLLSPCFLSLSCSLFKNLSPSYLFRFPAWPRWLVNFFTPDHEEDSVFVWISFIYTTF